MPNPPKPDDRSDNVEHLQESLSNTMENMRETEDYLKAHRGEIGHEQRADLARQQSQRAEAIEGFRDEIEDEAEDPSR
ncbi:MAG: small acid-soluble spore protein Tlp [Thermaerobacter sp.]|nr:small acid-soluble spore protein Tlp [Thermaerobacter sp.]